MSDETRERALGQVISDISFLMEDLYQSGFDTIHESSYSQIKTAIQTARQYGLSYLSDLLQTLYDTASARRHMTKKAPDGLAGIYVQIVEYLYLVKNRLAYDTGKAYYEQTYEIDEESEEE